MLLSILVIEMNCPCRRILRNWLNKLNLSQIPRVWLLILRKPLLMSD